MDVAKPISLAKQRRARAAWVFELGPVTLVFATIVLISMTSLLYLTQASRVAATGYDISAAEEEKARLERQRQLLEITAAQLQSLGRIESEATSKLHMAPAPPPEYLRVGEAPVDVEGALERALADAEHRPLTWQEQLVTVFNAPRAGR
jgi:cell division protein FtsL